MCGGFLCSKNALVALNVLYLIVSIILIAIGVYAKGASIVSSLPIVGGIVAAGVFLFLVAVVGLIGACKHHQVVLFFYMIVLFLVFLIQFFVAVACLALNEEQQTTLLWDGWNRSSDATRQDAEKAFHCCGYDSYDPSNCPKEVKDTKGCKDVLSSKIKEVLHVAGGVGLFFSFTEIMGIWLALRFRNLKDPRANPNALFT